MATESIATSLPLRTAKQSSEHPLAPLSAEEIQSAVAIVTAQWPAHTDLHFKVVTLEEPAKAETVPYLEAEFAGQQLPRIDRRVLVAYYIRKTSKFHEAIVNLSSRTVESNIRLGPNIHGAGDGEEIMAMERIALEHEGVQAELKKMNLPEGSVVVADPWIYGMS